MTVWGVFDICSPDMENNKGKQIEFIAVNCYGWGRADNPAEAISKFNLMRSTRPANSKVDYEIDPDGKLNSWELEDAETELAKRCKEWDEREAEARQNVSLWAREKRETIQFDNGEPDNATLIYSNAPNELNAFNMPDSNSVLKPGAVFIIRNHSPSGVSIIEGLAILVKPVGSWSDFRWVVQFMDDAEGVTVDRVIDPTDFMPFKG